VRQRALLQRVPLKLLPWLLLPLSLLLALLELLLPQLVVTAVPLGNQCKLLRLQLRGLRRCWDGRWHGLSLATRCHTRRTNSTREAATRSRLHRWQSTVFRAGSLPGAEQRQKDVHGGLARKELSQYSSVQRRFQLSPTRMQPLLRTRDTFHVRNPLPQFCDRVPMARRLVRPRGAVAVDE
jgi:hypothetical protein